MSYAWLALGAAIGAVFRFQLQTSLQHLVPNFPFPTIMINLVGSFCIGLFYPWISQQSDTYRLFINTGILGGFTTFSAFSLDFMQLWQRGQISASLLMLFISTVGGICLCFAGYHLASRLY